MVTQNLIAAQNRVVEIPAGRHKVRGILTIPRDPHGVVLFAHGSGSGRLSPRNRLVAQMLQEAGFATLLIDLLEDDESLHRRNVFDIELLSERLEAATVWLNDDPETSTLTLGYFGASTGAAAAVEAAARRRDMVAAVVSRGGRPDLAWGALRHVNVPTLLIVGGRDKDVLDLNQRALAELNCPKELVVVPGATHLFEEPGALERVARLAERWFKRYLCTDSAARHDPSTTRAVEPIPSPLERQDPRTGDVQ
jgi:putative phosphoribosyl transferase